MSVERKEFFEQRKALHELVRRYPGYARETIRRILGRGRGYVLVKGEGLVKATHGRQTLAERTATSPKS